MKVLVTGGAGFIGRYVVEALMERGHDPVILDHYNRQEHYPCPFIVADVTDDKQVTEAMAHVDSWIHLAAVLGTQETIQNPRPSAYANLMGGLNMLEAAAQYDTPGVYIGVGNHWMNNPYSISKTMVERYIKMYNKERGTKVNIVRAMNAYGPRQRPVAPWGTSKVRKITPSFICRALSGQKIQIYGDGKQISDMIYVTDVAKALVIALEKAYLGTVFEEAVEIGPEEHNTVNDIAKLIINIVAERPTSQFMFGPEHYIEHLPMRPGEIPNSMVIAETGTLSWVDMKPDNLVKLKDGLRRTVEYYAQNYGGY